MCPYIYGKSGYPWRTGTASWFTMLLLEWILGARRHYDGLLIDPCLTKEIKHAEVKRTFRGTIFNIELDNSAGNCLGAKEIYLDGKLIDGNIISLIDGKQHKVKVVI
jgi:cellobiose phosphorylase